eukprot:gnl/Chilomastix_caulleri/3340.p1 GENE.gnl/Chilomastix_caulleri/3340~~gnl/Chilomastix_caulleri/3340.p1  ORF type:complete len:88 (-),score=32.55 gnl/Chilomastix_caulleri/3340:339-602(-)
MFAPSAHQHQHQHQHQLQLQHDNININRTFLERPQGATSMAVTVVSHPTMQLQGGRTTTINPYAPKEQQAERRPLHSTQNSSNNDAV